MEKRVGIVGAGISGLIACKYVAERGFCPLVFEAKSSIGGCWTQTVATTKLQTSKAAFQFTDFHWPTDVEEEFPDHRQVLRYIESYAEHFKLLEHIKFNHTVVSLKYVGAWDSDQSCSGLWAGTGAAFGSSNKGRWHVSVQDQQQLETIKVYEVEFVILCVGRFSGVPNVPIFPANEGPEAFKGKVIHSMDYAAMDKGDAANLVKGKRIAVVGFSKSALDIAAECATANGVDFPCTMLVRSPEWNVQHYSPWGVDMAYLYGTRFSELLIHKPGEGFLLHLLATLFSPLRWLVARFVESYFLWTLPMKKYDMVPEHGFLQSVSSCFVTTLPENFYGRVEEGSITLKRATKWSFWEGGVRLGNEGESMDCDLVILGTGFNGEKKIKDLFESSAFRRWILGSPNGTLPLYSNGDGSRCEALGGANEVVFG